MTNVEIIKCLNDNFSYLIHDKSTNTVAIVDPSEFETCDRHLSKKFKKLDFILNTHHHADHIGGNDKLKKKYNSKILASKLDKGRIPNIDKYLDDKDLVNIGSSEFEVILIPGHTKGHIAFYSKKAKIIFTGDTLFSLGCGRIFEGTHNQMFNSLNTMKNLPGDTKVYFGHEYTKNNLKFCLNYDASNKYLKEKINWIDNRLNAELPTSPTTIEDELNTNIFLRCDKMSIKKNLKAEKLSDEEIFVKLRNLKDNF